MDAKTQKGEGLIEPGSVSQNDADQAASMITQLNQEQLKQAHKTTSISKQSAFVRFSAAERSMKPVHLAGVLPDDPEEAVSMFVLEESSSLWDWFHNLLQQAEEIVGWILQPASMIFRPCIQPTSH